MELWKELKWIVFISILSSKSRQSTANYFLNPSGSPNAAVSHFRYLVLCTSLRQQLLGPIYIARPANFLRPKWAFSQPQYTVWSLSRVWLIVGKWATYFTVLKQMPFSFIYFLSEDEEDMALKTENRIKDALKSGQLASITSNVTPRSLMTCHTDPVTMALRVS